MTRVAFLQAKLLCVWRTSYIAVSAALGASYGEIESSVVGGFSGEALSVSLSLRTGDRRSRALALARPLAQVARAVEATRIK